MKAFIESTVVYGLIYGTQVLTAYCAVMLTLIYLNGRKK